LIGVFKARIGALLVLVLIATTMTDATAATPIKIIDTRANAEYRPSVADGWEAWSGFAIAHPKRDHHGYVRPTGGATTKIPVRGNVSTGNIITSGPHAGQVVFRNDVSGNYNIRFYDLIGGTVSNAPKAANTSKDEYSATVSGDYMAFIRGFKSGNLFLYQFSTGTTTNIRSGVYAAALNGDYLAFSKFCTRTTCSVGRYQLSTGKSVRMPVPAPGRSLYHAAVAADGTMFWVEGSYAHCGRHTKIRMKSGSTVSTLWAAPAGDEVDYMLVDTLGGNPTLTYSLAKCPYSSNRWGAYRIDV
jgi:hypothetical protein